MLTNDTTRDGDEKSPWVQPGFLAAGAVVALLVVLGVALALTGGSKADSTPAPAPATPLPPAASAPRDSNASACGLRAGDQAIPNRAPTADWKLRGTLAAPSAPDTFGPGHDVGGVPSCFAHSPTGALFAMVNIQAAMTAFAQRGGSYPIDKVLRMIATGPGRDALANAVERQPVPTKGSRTGGVQVAGFTIVRYEPGSAVVDLAFGSDRPEAPGYAHGQSTLRWEEGDWKLVLAQRGGPFDAAQPIANLTGYTPWRGI